MTTPVTTDGDIVGAILDKSGNGHHLTQAFILDKPLYKTGGGLHWIESIDKNIVVSGLNVSQPITHVSAWRRLDDDTGALLGSNSNDLRVNATNLAAFSGSADVNGPARPDNNVDFVAICVFNGASSSIALDDGAPVGPLNPGTNASTSFSISAEGAGNQCHNRCYGIVIFDRLLLDPEIAQLRTYLAGKQGRVL